MQNMQKSARATLLFFNVILFQFPVKRTFRNSQILGGIFAFVMMFFQGFQDHFLFLCFQRKRFFFGFVRNIFHFIVVFFYAGFFYRQQVTVRFAFARGIFNAVCDTLHSQINAGFVSAIHLPNAGDPKGRKPVFSGRSCPFSCRRGLCTKGPAPR